MVFVFSFLFSGTHCLVLPVFQCLNIMAPSIFFGFSVVWGRNITLLPLHPPGCVSEFKNVLLLMFYFFYGIIYCVYTSVSSSLLYFCNYCFLLFLILSWVLSPHSWILSNSDLHCLFMSCIVFFFLTFASFVNRRSELAWSPFSGEVILPFISLYYNSAGKLTSVLFWGQTSLLISTCEELSWIFLGMWFPDFFFLLFLCSVKSYWDFLVLVPLSFSRPSLSFDSAALVWTNFDSTSTVPHLSFLS